MAFARELRKGIRKLTVITYSLDVFEVLHDLPEYTVMLTGGRTIFILLTAACPNLCGIFTQPTT